MELRSQAQYFAILAAAGWLAHGAYAADLRYEVRHDHWKGGGAGILIANADGIAFREAHKPKHSREWTYGEIQQIRISPRSLAILTYEDNKWRLGADREYRFDLTGENTFAELYESLKGHLDQRLVAALAEKVAKPLWAMPAKHLGRFGGVHGTLIISEDGVVYRNNGKGESRTWRYSDIENVSRTGPFRLTLTVYERARSHYGGLKAFNFQLKQALAEARYNDLWTRVNGPKNLDILNIYKKGSNEQ